MVAFSSIDARHGGAARGIGFFLPLGFLILDAFFIGLHGVMGVLLVTGRIEEWPDLINIDRDWSAGEFLNYCKWAVAAAALFGVWRTERLTMALFFALAFAFLLLDDGLSIHERLGAVVGRELPAAMGDVRSAAGEAAVFGCYAVVLGSGFALAWRCSGPQGRQVALRYVLLIALMGFFAVFADFAHSSAPSYSVSAGLLGLIEEAGEMLVLTAIAIYSLQLSIMR